VTVEQIKEEPFIGYFILIQGFCTELDQKNKYFQLTL